MRVQELSPTVRNGIRTWLIKSFGITLLLGMTPMVAAGQYDWPAAWALATLLLTILLLNAIVLIPTQPALLAQRAGMGAGTKTWDKRLAPFVALFGPWLTLIVAGLDRRWTWSGADDGTITLPALAVILLGALFSLWAMRSNPYFEGTVRIQTERNHQVVTRGPYRWLRHPGYVGGLLYNLAVPVALATWWAFLPAGLTIAAIIVRTALEDRTLRAELPGYQSYAARVRFRLLPGVW